MAASPSIGEVGSEPSEEAATSSHPGEVGSEPAPEVAATANVGEEEEDENRVPILSGSEDRLLSRLSHCFSPEAKKANR